MADLCRVVVGTCHAFTTVGWNIAVGVSPVAATSVMLSAADLAQSSGWPIGAIRHRLARLRRHHGARRTKDFCTWLDRGPYLKESTDG